MGAQSYFSSKSRIFSSPTKLGSSRINSPLPAPAVYRVSCMSAAAKRYKYLRRIFHFRHMDFEFAVWQVISSAGFSLVLGIHFWGFLKFLLYVVFVDLVGVGLVIATALWYIANTFLLKPGIRAQQDVEWGFCFDIHLNAFFPILVILHFVQLFVYHALIERDWFISTMFGNTLWLIALS